MKGTLPNIFAAPVLALSVTILWAGTSACKKSPLQTESSYIEKGKALRGKGENDRAILEFRNAGKAMPQDAEPYYQLGLTYVAKNDARNAFLYFTKAAERNPKHSGAQLQLATFQILGSSQEKGLLGEAQGRIEDVLTAAPENADALQLRAITEYQLGDRNASARDLQRALEKTPTHLKSAITLANLKLLQKDTIGAEAILKKSVEADPQSPDAALALADLYLRTGRKPEAETETKRAIQLDPKNGPALMVLASLQMDAGRKAEAEQTYRQISALPDPESKPMHAIFLFHEGKQEEAIAELNRLVKEAHGKREYRNLLISSYMTAGRPHEAERILTDVLTKNPMDADALLQRSGFYLNQRKYKQAELDLQSVLHYKADSAQAHYGLAKVHAARGQTLRQTQELGEALRQNMNLLPARLELAAVLRAKDPKAALKLLADAPERQKSLPDFIAERNWALIASKDYTSARKNVEASLAIGKTPALLYQDAVLRLEQKDFGRARASLWELLGANGEDVDALNLLARTYAAEGDNGKAVAALQTYAAKKPDSPYLATLVGMWQARTNSVAEARDTFKKVAATHPDYIPVRLVLAELEMATGGTDAARRALKEVLAKDAGNLTANQRLADLEIGAGNRAAARDYYEKVIQSDPNNAGALNNLAFLMADEKPNEALKYAQSAVELSPHSAAAQDTLGWVYYRQGIYSSALTYFKSAVAQEPTAVRRYHLALAYGKVGDEQQARENLNTALKLDPKLQMPEALAR